MYQANRVPQTVPNPGARGTAVAEAVSAPARPLRRRTNAYLAAALWTGFCAGAQAGTFGIDWLMGALADGRRGTVVFTETKYLSILDLPLESSGQLHFSPPAHLIKRTLSPVAETLELDGDMLVVEQKGRRRTLRLDDFPQVAVMVEGLRATLAGDRQSLERVYRLALAGDPEDWTLQLTPLDSGFGGLVSHIEVQGVRGEVHQVEIQQADGDRSVMRVHPDRR